MKNAGPTAGRTDTCVSDEDGLVGLVSEDGGPSVPRPSSVQQSFALRCGRRARKRGKPERERTAAAPTKDTVPGGVLPGTPPPVVAAVVGLLGRTPGLFRPSGSTFICYWTLFVKRIQMLLKKKVRDQFKALLTGSLQPEKEPTVTRLLVVGARTGSQLFSPRERCTFLSPSK